MGIRKSTLVLYMYCLINFLVKRVNSNMPTEHEALMQEEYERFMKSKGNKESKTEPELQKPTKPFSPKDLGITRDPSDIIPLSDQALIPAGSYWFGTQMGFGTAENNWKVLPKNIKDGAEPRLKKLRVKSFLINTDVVTYKQFNAFIQATKYITEAEVYGWSFVLEATTTKRIVKVVDGKIKEFEKYAYGRVKDAPHWLVLIYLFQMEYC